LRVSVVIFFFFSSRRRHTRFSRDWSSDVCSSDLEHPRLLGERGETRERVVHLRRRPVEEVAASGTKERVPREEQAVDEEREVPEIGRASCREREERWVAAASGAKKKKGKET